MCTSIGTYRHVNIFSKMLKKDYSSSTTINEYLPNVQPMTPNSLCLKYVQDFKHNMTLIMHCIKRKR